MVMNGCFSVKSCRFWVNLRQNLLWCEALERRRSNILNMMLILVLPIAFAASIFPFSISKRLLSTILAYIGIQLAAIAIMQAFVPYDFPKMSLATGIMRMIMIIWGSDLNALITHPETVYDTFSGTRPSGFDMVRRIPMIRPSTSVIRDDIDVMYKVSPIGPNRSFQISEEKDATITSHKDESNKLIFLLLRYRCRA